MKADKGIKGYSLIELLVGICISTVMLGALATNLFRQTSNYFALKQSVDRQVNLEALGRITERVMQDLDTHPLPLYPVVHNPGRVTLSDGSILTLADLSTESPAISSIRLRYDQVLKITAVTENFSNLEISACRVFTNIERESPVELRQALLLHPEFMSETLASFSLSSTDPDCYLVELKPVVGMFTAETQIKKLALAKRLIPIEWIRTHYLTENGTLRVVGHTGSSVIFNQPVFSGSSNFNLELELSPVPDHVQLKLSMFEPARQSFSLVVQHRVPRVDALNLILNL